MIQLKHKIAQVVSIVHFIQFTEVLSPIDIFVVPDQLL